MLGFYHSYLKEKKYEPRDVPQTPSGPPSGDWDLSPTIREAVAVLEWSTYKQDHPEQGSSEDLPDDILLPSLSRRQHLQDEDESTAVYFDFDAEKDDVPRYEDALLSSPVPSAEQEDGYGEEEYNSAAVEYNLDQFIAVHGEDSFIISSEIAASSGNSDSIQDNRVQQEYISSWMDNAVFFTDEELDLQMGQSNTYDGNFQFSAEVNAYQPDLEMDEFSLLKTPKSAPKNASLNNESCITHSFNDYITYVENYRFPAGFDASCSESKIAQFDLLKTPRINTVNLPPPKTITPLPSGLLTPKSTHFGKITDNTERGPSALFKKDWLYIDVGF